MRKIAIGVSIIVLCWLSANAQKKNYQFNIGSDVCVTPGQKIIMILEYNDVRPVIAGQPKWYVNGEPAEIQDPGNGIVKVSKMAPAASYTAPAHAPNKNPVTVSCVFNIKDDITNFSKFKTSPQQVTVVCRVFVADNYKINIRLEAQGHNEEGGPLHCLITGKGTLSYKAAKEADGCCPGWQDGKIDFTVNDLTYANSGAGTIKYKSPATFSNDYSATLDLCDDKPKLVLNFKNMGPGEENYETGKGDQLALSRNIETLFEAVLADQTKKRFEDLGSRHSEAELTALANRAQAHQNDARYWKTAQGIKDKAELKELQGEVGKLDGGAASMVSQMSAIQADFNKSGPKPVHTIIKATSFSGGSSGWDSGSITIELGKQ